MTAPALAPASVLFPDLDQELAITRRTLERFPEGKDGWKPHERSTSLGQLAVHLAMLPGFGQMIIESDELDFAARPYVPRPFKTAADLVAIFDEAVAGMRPLVAAADGDALARGWTMRAGEQVFLSAPKGALIRQLMISHIIHHRAQLGVYYRLLGVAVPSVYGPSADEPM
jgi:hypothetical protein